jgi:diadenosine tetraphosphatase ApaH/serine/threonine PP2A family protein phosphatase
VLDSIDAHRPDHIFCLGDLVGYAPWPNEVVDAIRRRHIPTIAGNYDEGVGLDSNDCGCAYETDRDQAWGDASIGYTNEIIDEDHRRWLRTLPRHIRLDVGPEADYSILMVHGSPRRINEYLYEDRPESSMWRMMESAGADVMLFGHTHKPYHRIVREQSGDGARHAINTGSVGKPKDGDPRACWVMIEVAEEPTHGSDQSIDVEFVRVEYDVDSAARGIERSPLPDPFAEMLRLATSTLN